MDTSALSRLVAAAALCVLAVVGVHAEERVALVIGNSDYPAERLDNPQNDATDMSAALRDAGFKVITRTNANTREMRQAVREFGSELRRADVGLFYFAGHGVQITGTNYLVPVAADIRNEADIEDLSLDVNYVLRTMEDAQVKVRIVILDACRNNPYARASRSSLRGLAPVNAASGSFVAFATAPGSVAADGQGRNGLYTKHLLESLRQPDTEILHVFQRARAGVVRETGGKQTPWEATSLLGEFRFRGAATAEASGAAPAPTPVGPLTTMPAGTASPAPPPAQHVAMAEPQREQPAQQPAPVMQSTQPAVQHSTLSYGGVTSQVQKSRTTQLDLVQMFGGPNISTTDGEGTEVWVYERSVSETERRNKSDGWQAAANLGVFFSAAGISGGGSTGRSSEAGSTTTSFRSLTVIVKFNPNKTVREYSVRSSQF